MLSRASPEFFLTTRAGEFWAALCHILRSLPFGGATARLRSGAEVRRTPCPKGSGQEELPHVRGQGQQPRVPDGDGTGMAERSYPRPRSGAATRGVIPRPRSGAAAGRRYPTPLSRRPRAAAGGATPHPRPGLVAGRNNSAPWQAQKGLEELSQVEGQEGRW